ncbi:epidermis-specific secreted glycoprotein EP1-like [Senna tora]|uniref:Epidermis-specific secreted glycoprotein EP1-like n=1 Tax=Senna tora TaxID=362788 RepID=A0A834WMU7_9FABA|nr:epidermis-specific secreted glycoprotein EP1-like [Senna tora]
MPSFPSIALFLIFSYTTFAPLSQAAVPQNQTFNFAIDDDFGPYITEYDASYIMLSIFASPFQFAFYNTTPNEFYLAIRMGLRRSESLFRWAWEANRGSPVHQNASFSFGTDGNLVLAEANGTIAWQSNTANKGVVGYKFFSNGNLVLYDSKGSFVWQSFDYPTDTLLVGQSLKAGGPASKLVSRVSEVENANGPYSLVLEPKGLTLYYTNKNSPKKPIKCSSMISIPKGILQNVTLSSDPETFEVNFDYGMINAPEYSNQGTRYLANPVNNSTLTYLRLGIDGNVRMLTYFVNVRQGVWRETYALYDRDNFVNDESECQWPEKCGAFGLCEDNQCVACPSSQGLKGWSKDCKAKAVTSCRASDFHYYKLEGVEHYMSKYNSGDRVSESGCESKCTKDCKCVGYFYKKEVSRCWVAYDLRTLAKVANSSHVGGGNWDGWFIIDGPSQYVY